MINIHFEDTPVLTNLSDRFYNNWLNEVCKIEYKKLGEITLIFCSDDYLLEVNREYLDHDYYTDIITFDYTDDDLINGDLFISIDRVADNANELSISFEIELNRVIVHGVLHLCGYKDKTPEEEQLMRSKENQMLAILS
jgi:probable rRNA maturation factor